MNVDLTDPVFHAEDKAREWLEASRWPNGPTCPHCGSVRPARMGGTSGRPGLFHCPDCRGWNHRVKLGVEDAERAAAAVYSAEGKRLTWRRPDAS